MGGKSSKMTFRLVFKKNGTMLIDNSTGTDPNVIVMSDFRVYLRPEQLLTNPTYTVTTNGSQFVKACNDIVANFKLDISLSDCTSVNTCIDIRLESGGPYVFFNKVLPYMQEGMELYFNIILDPRPNTKMITSADTFSFKSIQSTNNIGNINVYMGEDNTNYYDRQLDIPVNTAIMPNLSNANGDYLLYMTLENGIIRSDTSLMSFVNDVKYSENEITIICSGVGQCALRAKISSADINVPSQLSLLPSYSENIITISILGTRLDLIPKYKMVIMLYLALY